MNAMRRINVYRRRELPGHFKGLACHSNTKNPLRAICSRLKRGHAIAQLVTAE